MLHYIDTSRLFFIFEFHSFNRIKLFYDILDIFFNSWSFVTTLSWVVLQLSLWQLKIHLNSFPLFLPPNLFANFLTSLWVAIFGETLGERLTWSYLIHDFLLIWFYHFVYCFIVIFGMAKHSSKDSFQFYCMFTSSPIIFILWHPLLRSS